MAKSSDRRKRREILWKQDPYCHWCGRITQLIKRKGKFRCEPDQATLDHLFHRLDPARQILNVTSEQRYVIACYECNIKRGAERQKIEQFLGNPLAFDSESIERRSLERWNGRLLYRIGEVSNLTEKELTNLPA